MAKLFSPVEQNSDKRTYCVPFSLAPTVAMDLVSLQVRPLLVLRVRRITIDEPGAQTAAGVVVLQYGYASALGTGGVVATAGNYGIGDNDVAFSQLPGGGVVRVGDTTVATGFVRQGDLHIYVPGALAAGSEGNAVRFGHDGAKAPSIRGGDVLADVWVLRHPGVAGAAGFAGYVEFTVEGV